MNLYFVYRSPYEPTSKYLKVFQGESLLAWFGEKWPLFKAAEEEKAFDLAIELFDKYVYGFNHLIDAVSEERLRKPATFKKLVEYISEHCYNNEVYYSPGCIQVHTDDDELEMAWYFFDESYAQANLGKVAFLLYGEVALPTQYGNRPFTPSGPTKVVATHPGGEGSTYLAFFTAYAGDNLEDFEGVLEIKGVRMDTLAEYLRQSPLEQDISFELNVLQKMLASKPTATLADTLQQIAQLPLLDIYEMPRSGPDYHPAHWQQLKGRLDHNPEKSFHIVAQHVAQLSIHTGDVFNQDSYHYWVIFDDRWAGENSLLANGLIHYAQKWNFLA